MTWLDGLAKVLPVERFYDDLASPAAKEVGSVALNTVKAARFIVAPIDYLAAQQGRWQNFLKRVSDQVPEERLIPAHPHIAGQAIEGLKYLEQDGILAELFINLLARAIDKERVSEAHPAFASIITQLSPDEALIIYKLSKKQYRLEQYSSFNQSSHTFSGRTDTYQEFPCATLAFPQNYHMYMSHLHSLNLAGVWQSGNQIPTNSNGVQTGVKIVNHAQLTSFGELFAKACMPETIENFEQGVTDAQPKI